MSNGVKTIFVTGATGNQGGAVADHLLRRGHRVKALTRNPALPKAMRLQKEGAVMIKGDLTNPFSYKEHVKNVDAIFSVQSFEHGVKSEILQGMALADCAREFNVGQLVYASVAGADLQTGIPHFESKHAIEQHIKSLRIP